MSDSISARLTKLAAKATEEGRPDLAAGYRHAEAIVNDWQTKESGISIEDAKAFCDRHCFVGRRDGPGKADDCSICPFAQFTLGVIDDDDNPDDAAVERQRAERIKREAAAVKNKLEEMGTDTLAAESHQVRMGPGHLQPVDS